MKTNKPDKPQKDDPLFTDANGPWAKMISGKLCNFGKWADPDGAETRYLDESAPIFPRHLAISHTVEDIDPASEVSRPVDREIQTGQVETAFFVARTVTIEAMRFDERLHDRRIIFRNRIDGQSSDPGDRQSCARN